MRTNKFCYVFSPILRIYRYTNTFLVYARICILVELYKLLRITVSITVSIGSVVFFICGHILWKQHSVLSVQWLNYKTHFIVLFIVFFVDEGFTQQSFECMEYEVVASLIIKQGVRSIFWKKFKQKFLIQNVSNTFSF